MVFGLGFMVIGMRMPKIVMWLADLWKEPSFLKLNDLTVYDNLLVIACLYFMVRSYRDLTAKLKLTSDLKSQN